MNSIYYFRSYFTEIHLYEDRGLLFLKRFTLYGKELYCVPVEEVDKSVSFSRAYHWSIYYTIGFPGIFAAILAFKSWGSGHWSFYFGILVLAFVFAILVKYLIWDIRKGETTFSSKSFKFSLAMKKSDFLKLQEKLKNL